MIFVLTDPKQRLALFRKLEETTKLSPIRPVVRRTLPRKEYFQGKNINRNILLTMCKVVNIWKIGMVWFFKHKWHFQMLDDG